MSLADALYWEKEMSPETPKSPWKNPLEETPLVNIQDPSVSYRKESVTVLVKIKKASFDVKPYVALAKYTCTNYGDGEQPVYRWYIEHHTGNWDSQVIGWFPIPLLGD